MDAVANQLTIHRIKLESDISIKFYLFFKHEKNYQ